MGDPIVIPPSSGKHQATVIFLHGLGDTGHGWAAGFDSIKHPNVKYVFPNAPVAPVTLNGGFPCPSWFDIISLDPQGGQDEKGIKKASNNLLALVEKEVSSGGIPASKVIIGGFSQGGATALYTAATSPKQLGGVVALSAFLPLHQQIAGSEVVHKSVPVLQCHGDADPVVAFFFGEMSAQMLKGKGMSNYTFNKHSGMAHGSCDKEMKEVKDFIKKIVG